MNTTAFVGKTALPQTIPVSASIDIDRLPSGEEGMLALTKMLADGNMLINAIAISSKRLCLTAHIGSEEVRKSMDEAGFTLGKWHLESHQLTRLHDNTPLNPHRLAERLLHVKMQAPEVLLEYKVESTVAGLNESTQGNLAENLTLFFIPGVARSLALTFSMDPSRKPSCFDDIILNGLAKSLEHRPATVDWVEKQIVNEMKYLAKVVGALYPTVMGEFLDWSAQYKDYLTELWTQRLLAHKLVVSAVEPVQDDSGYQSSDRSVSEAQSVIMQNDLDSFNAPKAGIQHQARFKEHLSVLVWQFPPHPTGEDAELNVPFWALNALADWSRLVGSWLVKMPWGEICVMSNEQFLLSFNLNE